MIPSHRFASTLLLSLVSVAAVTAAHAAPPPFSKIVDTGIAEFDEVFAKARDMQGTLQASHTSLAEARSNLNTALGVATDTPVETALKDLKTKADGKIKLVMEGKRPKLEATEAVPENVQQGIDAANKLGETSVTTTDTADELRPRSEELATATKDFPAKVPTLVKNPMEVGKKGKQVKGNVKAVGELPEQVDGLRSEATGVASDISAVFGG
jgi:hypothetical protein